MPGGEKNTFGLPEGEAIRKEMVAIFREQRLALLDWMDSEGYKAFGLPPSWPSWGSLKLGASDIAARVKGAITDIWSGSQPTLDVNTSPVSVEIETQAQDLGAAANETTTGILNRLLGEVKDLFNRGRKTLAESISMLREGVTEGLKPMEAWRARRIAVTEAARSYHEAMIAAAHKSGVITGWRWMCADGACDLCLMIEAEARFVRLDQPFALIGTGYYSVIESPPAHPNCRCSLGPVVLSDDQPDWAETLMDPDPNLVSPPVPS